MYWWCGSANSLTNVCNVNNNGNANNNGASNSNAVRPIIYIRACIGRVSVADDDR